MKFRCWWCLWLALGGLQAVCLLAISGMAWFTGRVQRWADAAEIDMLLARAERVIAAKRGKADKADKADRRARPRRGGPQP